MGKFFLLHGKVASGDRGLARGNHCIYIHWTPLNRITDNRIVIFCWTGSSIMAMISLCIVFDTYRTSLFYVAICISISPWRWLLSAICFSHRITFITMRCKLSRLFCTVVCKPLTSRNSPKKSTDNKNPFAFSNG